MIDRDNMTDLLKNISITELDPYRKMVKNIKTGEYVICDNSTNEVESKGVINPNPPNPEYQHQKGSEQQSNNIVDNSFALEMYGLVNLCSGKTSIYDEVQTMTTAYPHPHQRQYLKASQQQQRSNNNRNAIELYELVQFIGGGKNINDW
jgi:hypothetical protein